MVIHKYSLPQCDRFTLEMPDRAQIIRLAMQGPTPWIWAIVDPAAAYVERSFAMYGTGWDMPDDLSNLQYIGTVDATPYVWHYFEVIG